MGSVTITYHAPEGDSPYVETRGMRLFDGQAVALDEAEHAEFIKKAHGNPHFEVIGATKAILKALTPEIKSEAPAGGWPHDSDFDAMVKEAEAFGIKVDGRWSKARLETEISAAKIAKA